MVSFQKMSMQIADPERRLALTYVARSRRVALAALWQLDELLADIIRTTREPVVGQMRLAWWHEALMRIGSAPTPAHPLLQALAAHVVPAGVEGGALAAMVDGWETLLGSDELDDAALMDHAEARGGALFKAAGMVVAGRALGAKEGAMLRPGGAGWALVDLACHLRDAGSAKRAAALAAPLIEDAMAARWPVAARPLGMLVALALRDVRCARWSTRRQGAPLRLLAMARHRLTGR
jgi:phytoene synthase